MAARPPSSAIGGVVADEHVMVVERRFAGQAAGQAADAADAAVFGASHVVSVGGMKASRLYGGSTPRSTDRLTLHSRDQCH